MNVTGLATSPISELIDRYAERLLLLTPEELGRMLGVAKEELSHLRTLSPREREVYDLVVVGNRSTEIARRIAISIKTVQTHRAKINKKLNARSTADLVRMAAHQGLL